MNKGSSVLLGVFFLTSSALAGSAQPVSKTTSPAGVCCSTPSGSPLLLQRQAKSPVSPTATLATVLTFEGLGNQEGLANFYNGGTGGNGSGPGPNFGITFSSNALAIIDADAGGTGNFGGEPSPSTIMFFLTGAAATMNVPAGFTDGFSFFYSAINSTGVVTVYDGPNATGAVLATLPLPLTPNNGAPDPTGQFSPLVPLGVTFSGTARSVDFGGAQNQIGFDDITIGSATPGVVSSTVPTLSFWAMGLLALALAAGGFLVTKRIV